ncbi:MAG: hypothetical protein H6736_01140 [Alphaproteobacteria bacterium]|nr:hypothetical protein [Alphaproteobacteria bacterium]
MLLLPLLLACPKSRVQKDEQLAAALAAIDAAWVVRATKGFQPVAEAVEAARAIAPEAPGLAWREVRLGVARGLMEPDATKRVRTFADARERGWECVLADPRVSALRLEVSLTEALAEVPEERRACASWAALAWMRWAADFGLAASALDETRVDALLEVPATADGKPAWRWAGALASLWDERRDGEPGTALRALSRASDDPSEGAVWVDLHVLADGEPPALTKKTPASPEARAYQERILAGR